jgi:transposase-like protein
VSGKRRRSFTREFKLSALRRMAETDNIVALARELNVERKLLYCWRERYAGGGAAALRRAGRPSTAELGSEALEPAAMAASDPARPIAALERKVGQQQFELDFFSRSLAAGQGATPFERRAWRTSIYAVIHAMMQRQGNPGIERLCALAGVSRAGYYRHWQASAPRQAETAPDAGQPPLWLPAAHGAAAPRRLAGEP